MKLLRLSLAVPVLALLAACSAEDEPQMIQATGHNELLSYVPDDTPYVVANLEPVPDAVVDSYLERLQPLAEELQTELTKARSDLDPASGEPGDKLMAAVLQELDGNLSREGMASLGIDLNARHVMYGEGAFPIYRMTLANSDTLRATIQRIMTNADMEFSELTHQGIGYWRLSDEPQEDQPLGVYISIMPDHLALGVSPLADEAVWLPRFLGIEKPDTEKIAGQLQKLNAKYGYTPYGSGFLDTRRFVDQFLDSNSSLAQLLDKTGEFDSRSVSQACVDEIHGMTDQVPKMIVGLTELESNVMGSEFRLQIIPSLTSRLLQLTANLPLADKESAALMELSLGLKVGATREFLREKMQGIIDQPYQCEHFEDLNTQAAKFLEQLSQPMPPFVNNFRGLRALIKQLPSDEQLTDQAAMIADSRGLLALHVEKPEMLVGMGQMMLPDLAEMNLVAGEPPIQLPASIVPFPGVVSFVAMTDHALGVSVGEGEEAGLSAFLGAEEGPDGVLMSASYDAARYATLSSQWADQLQSSIDSEMESETGMAMQRAIEEVYEKMLDRAYMDLRFDEDGMAAYSSTTLK